MRRRCWTKPCTSCAWRMTPAIASRASWPPAGPKKMDSRPISTKLSGHPKLKGVRRILHTHPDELGQGKMFIENVARLETYGLSFDFCVLARQLPVAINLASKCPGVAFVLDHCGVPEVKDQVLDPWREHIRELSKLPNVACKISGLVAYADPANWKAEDLRPFVEHVIESFGWDRVMFGSDWPVCNLTASYTAVGGNAVVLTACRRRSEPEKVISR